MATYCSAPSHYIIFTFYTALTSRWPLDGIIPCKHPKNEIDWQVSENICSCLPKIISVQSWKSICMLFLVHLSLVSNNRIMKSSSHFLSDSYIDGLVQGRHNSSALAMELHLSCINPSICDANPSISHIAPVGVHDNSTWAHWVNILRHIPNSHQYAYNISKYTFSARKCCTVIQIIKMNLHIQKN